jgi:hypothetical protein
VRNAQVRTLLAGIVLAGSGAVLTLVGGSLGVVEIWPVLLVAGSGLLIGVPRLRHALAHATGILAGSITVWAGAAVLPTTPAGRALATVAGVLLITVSTLATRGQLRLSMQLIGWAATVALAGPPASRVMTGGVALVASIGTSAVTLLVAAGLGLLVAQVTQLVGAGTVGIIGTIGGIARRGRRGSAAAVVAAVASAGLVGAVLAPSAALAEPVDGRGVVEHRQTVVRSFTADGTPTGGTVITELSVSGIPEASVVLRDQAVRGLRSLTGLAQAGPVAERATPDVVGRTVTHRLSDGGAVRTVAALDRTLPVGIEVAVTLDGEPTTPSAVVGRSGRISITYTLTNRTATTQEIRSFDGTGRPRTTVREVAVPFVGELVVVLDDRFRAVRSDDARVGDGVLHAELVLAAPVGAPVRTVTWSADVDEAVVPPLQVRVAPVAIADTARGGADLERLRRSTDALRAIADDAGLARTGVTAFLGLSEATATTTDDELAASTLAILDGLLASAAAAGAELDEVRALIDAQDARVRDGDGLVHPLLVAADVRTGDGPRSAARTPRVDASVVYVLDVAGQGEESVPGTAVRILLALGLLLAVGLLGRAVDRLTGPDRA